MDDTSATLSPQAVIETPKGKGKALEVPTRRQLEIALGTLDDVLKAPSGHVSKRKNVAVREPPTFSTPKLMHLLHLTESSAKILNPSPAITLSSDPKSLPGLLSRLATLRPTAYSDMQPRGWDAATVAGCGWQAGKSRGSLLCATCGAEWRPDPLGSSIGSSTPSSPAQIEARKAQTILKHQPACPWRVRQCPGSLYRLPLTSKTSIMAQLASRFEGFAERPDALASFRLADIPGIGETDIAYLRALLMPKGQDESPDAPLRLILALTGWTLSGSATLPTLACARCHRAVGMWPYTGTQGKSFDALAEHRPFCAFLHEAAWRKQIQRRGGAAEKEGTYNWAWKGEGVKRQLAVHFSGLRKGLFTQTLSQTRDVRQYVRDVLDARPAKVAKHSF